MSVLLEQDRRRPVQDHFDELTWRTTVLFASVALMTVVWSFAVDDVLAHLLGLLKPCAGDCLNVYDPAQWSAVRWLSSLLLATFSCLPLAVFHVLSFSKPGLLPSEYTALRRWIVVLGSTMLVLTTLLMTRWLPELYEFGFQQHAQAGLSAQYSAIDMLLVAAYLAWSMLVITATWTALRVMGRLGLLNNTTANVWRLRLYGLGSLLLMLSIPDHARSMLLPLLAAYWISSELIGQRWLNASPALHGRASTRLDEEGRQRRVMLVDCSCDGGNAHHGFASVPGCSTLSVASLCTDPLSRTTLFEHLMTSQPTDAMITGCDTKACPKSLIENLQTLNVQLHGLNLMSLQNHRVLNPTPDRDVELAFHNCETFFPASYRQQRTNEFVERHGFSSTSLHLTAPNDRGTWAPYCSSDEMVVP